MRVFTAAGASTDTPMGESFRSWAINSESATTANFIAP